MADTMRQKFDRGVSLLSWAYQEEESIVPFLERAHALMEECVDDFEIVLIEDGSTDRTLELACAFAQAHPRVRVLPNERNLNVGLSSRRAIKEARKEYLFWQTTDWGYDISELRDYLELLKTYDIVQGVRVKPVEVRVRLLRPIVAVLRLLGMKHLTRRSDTVPKALVSVVNYLVVRFFFRMPLSDFQNVTFYPAEWIQSVTLEARSSFANPEGLIKSFWNGMTIKEVPLSFIPRGEGSAKGTRVRAIVASVTDILRLWFKWVVLRKRGKIHKGTVYRIDGRVMPCGASHTSMGSE
ncbi:glycosyltransferase family 2 protein [bacterium]|nr:glycosyltransferase family 2 protein [bacterium]